MGSINRGRQRSFYFRFETNEELTRFIKLYRDLFVPYSEVTIREKTKGNELMAVTMRNGYMIENYKNMLTLTVLMMPESLNEILNSGAFDKIRAHKCQFYYKLKAA